MAKNTEISRHKLSMAEVITILITFHLGGFRNLKHYYEFYVKKHLSKFKLFGVLLAHTFVEKILAGNYSFFRQNRIFSSSLAEYRWQSCFPASRPKVQDVL